MKNFVDITKEEIYAKLILLEQFRKNHPVQISVYNTQELYLNSLLPHLKSIQDLQKEAFEAGREGCIVKDVHESNINLGYQYDTFDDYLKTLEK